MSRLEFDELISVFNMHVWLLLLLSWVFYFVMEYASFHFSKSNEKSSNGKFKLGRKILSFIRMFVEQGSALEETNSALRKANRRFILGSIVLAAIVLSNAYKNTNVYNMIMPRMPIPMDTLEKLVKNGFRIFSRARLNESHASIYYFRDYFGYEYLNVTTNQHKIRMRIGNDYKIIATSEISFMSTKITSNQTEIKNDTVVILLRNSQIFPDTLERLSQAMDYKKGDNSFDPYFNFRHLEENKIAKILENCGNSAALLPHSLALEQIKNLSTKHVKGISYKGKEAWFASDIEITLNGFVTRNNLIRIDGLRQSGIWQWWEENLTSMGRYLEDHKCSTRSWIHRPTMDGNILVIFTVWLIGLGVAIMKFICEVGMLKIY